MTGSCHCGAVEYEILAEPVTCYACHCTDCQTQSGSAFSMSMIVPISSLTVQSGQCSTQVEHRSTGDVEHHRCAVCGTRMWSVGSGAPDLAFVKPGTLRDTSAIRPVAHFWTKSAQPWVEFDGDTKLYETQPDDPSELIRLWQERAQTH